MRGVISEQDRIYFVNIFDFFIIENYTITINEMMHCNLLDLCLKHKESFSKYTIIRILKQLFQALEALQVWNKFCKITIFFVTAFESDKILI